MAADRNIALARCQHAYEASRAWHAATLATPLIALSLLGVCIGTHPLAAIGLGVGLLMAAWLFLWRGQALGRAVLPGVLAGLIPLSFAIASRSYGHACMGSRCISLCVPACTLGGLLAGMLIAHTGRHGISRRRSLVGAGVLAVLVGSVGCSCVGSGGVAGLAIGLLAVLLPATLFHPQPVH